MFQIIKTIVKKLKLFLLYWRRIVFVRNHFKCSLWTKLHANIFGGFLADQYMLYDFKTNDKREYLSEFDWYRSRYINEPFDFVLNNKIISTEVLKHYTKVPEIYAMKIKGRLTSFRSQLIEYSDILDMLKVHQSAFMKPFGAGKGTGVCKLTFNGSQFGKDMQPIETQELLQFLKKEDNWMICETIQQSSYAASLYAHTVNTLRIITFRDIHTDAFQLFFAVQRIGTEATIPVDNGSRGGLVSKIDMETGKLSAAKCLHHLGEYTIHPDSKSPIEGIVVPQWQKIKEHVLYLSNQMPYMSFIAWDLLLTEDGMCIIEANTSSGVNIVQLWGGQRNKELGDFYKHHHVIR